MKILWRSHLYGMAAVQCVQVQSAGVIGRDKLSPDVVLRETVIHTQVLDPGREPFVEPQVGPPFLWTCTRVLNMFFLINLVYFVMNGSLADYHGDQVAKPLVSQLVSDDQRHPLLGWWAGVFGVDEKRRLPGRKNKEKEMYFWSVIMFPSVTLPEVIKWNQGASGRGRKTNSACCRWWSPDRWQCVWLSDQLLNRH